MKSEEYQEIIIRQFLETHNINPLTVVVVIAKIMNWKIGISKFLKDDDPINGIGIGTKKFFKDIKKLKLGLWRNR